MRLSQLRPSAAPRAAPILPVAAPLRRCVPPPSAGAPTPPRCPKSRSAAPPWTKSASAPLTPRRSDPRSVPAVDPPPTPPADTHRCPARPSRDTPPPPRALRAARRGRGPCRRRAPAPAAGSATAGCNPPPPSCARAGPRSLPAAPSSWGGSGFQPRISLSYTHMCPARSRSAARSFTTAWARAAALGVNATHADRACDPVNRQHVGRDAVVHLVLVCVLHHRSKARVHDLLQLLVHLRFFPEISLAILHPFEIRNRDPARIRQDVGNHEYALFLENVVGRRGRGPIGPLAHDLGLNRARILAGDLVLGRCRHQNVARMRQQFARLQRRRAWKALDRLVLRPVRQKRLDVQPLQVQDPAIVFVNADNLISIFRHQLGGVAA